WLSAGAGYISFVRAARYPKVEAKPPTDLPSSRAFRGVGQAFLNTSLLDARDNVEILFKSSPFGTQSHGYDAQNSFQLYAFGQPLLVSSGVRDIYGSDHHANWMWETKSCNNITIGPGSGSADARGQIKHSPKCVGRITAFSTSPAVDFVQGDASRAYDPPLRKFTRSILFCKPDVIVIVDDLETDSPEVFQYRLHSPAAMKIAGQGDISIAAEKASCAIALLSPEKLELSYTDKFDVPPRERIKLTQYHLTASTREPAARQRFVAVIRPFRPGQQSAAMPKIEQSDRGVIVRTARLAVRIAGDKIETLP
ncbi:MAG: hypothetical protein QOE14_2689, partial [Humisphaera sp.]|nr:hypothetical protein [Humisphaera sp.]